MTNFFVRSCLFKSPLSSSPSRKTKKEFELQNTLLCLFFMGLCWEDQLAGFTGSCSRWIPYSQSGTQASKLFSGHKVRSRGCVITSKQTYHSYRLKDKWIGNLSVELPWTDTSLLAFIIESRDCSALRAWVLLSYLERQFSFVCCSLALKQVLAAGLSGQQCINHMNPTAGETATKGQDLMSSAESTKRVNVGFNRALKRDESNSLSIAQSKHFSSFLLNK